MKVLLINKFLYKRGGSETYNFALAEALQKKGHEVIYFAMQDEKNIETPYSKYFVSNVDYNNNNGIASKLNSVKSFFYSKEAEEKMEELIANEHPDIAHIGLIHRQITFSVVEVLKKHNIPIVMTMHDLIFACPNYTMLTNGKTCEKCVAGSSLNCIKQKCVKNSLAKSVLAAAEKEYLVQKKYYDDIDLYITECKLYKDLFEKSKVTKSKIIYKTNFLPVTQDYGFKKSYKEYILYFGRFSQEKGIITLLKAHQRLHCKYKMILVGTGPLEEDIKKFIDDNHITNVTLPGSIYGNKMEKIIEEAKVIVTPSEWYENCPYALLQSMAKGKIEVVSRIGGLPELIEDGKTGFLFEAGKSELLAETIDHVMKMTEEDYETMSNRIADTAKIRHHWEQYADFIIEQYKYLIAQKIKLKEK